MPNLMKLMKQAASMQKDIERVQREMGEKVVEFSAAGGMVTAQARCDNVLVSLKIDPRIVDPQDLEMLEDSVKAAVNGALTKAKETMTAEMGKVTAGFNVPGLGGLA